MDNDLLGVLFGHKLDDKKEEEPVEVANFDRNEFKRYLIQVKTGRIKIDKVPEPYKSKIGGMLYGKEVEEHSSFRKGLGDLVQTVGDYGVDYCNRTIDFAEKIIKNISDMIR